MVTKANSEFLYLSQEDVIAAGGLNMKKAIKDIEESFKLLALNKVILPSKTVLDLNEKKVGRINCMPAYVGGQVNRAGIKWMSGFPKNPFKYGLPRGIGIIVLNDASNGKPLAIMDSMLISAMRTGAATGVGAKYLAREDAEEIGIIGCGVQARTQLRALLEVLKKISKVKVYDINKEASLNFVKTMSDKLDVDIESVDSVEEAVKEADAIITVTIADEPLVKKSYVKRGALFIHVGSYQEEEYELILKSDKIVVDNWEEVKHRRTPTLAKMFFEKLIKDEDIYTELGNIIINKKPGRENDKERIYFLPIGMGIHDIVLANRIYNKAKTNNIGTKLNLWHEIVDL